MGIYDLNPGMALMILSATKSLSETGLEWKDEGKW